MSSEATATEDRAEGEDLWLRGYFLMGEGDRKTTLKGGKYYKNRDFLRLRDVALHLLDPKPGSRIFDIGCANGATMVYCGLQGAEVRGMDLNGTCVDKANRYLTRFGITGQARVGDARRIDEPNASFDGVISSDFVEHIDEETKVEVFREALRILKPGGVLVTKTPNLAYLRTSLLFKRARAVLRLRNPMEIVIPQTPGTDDPQHIGLVDRWALTRSLVAAGFVNYQFFYAPLRRMGSSPVIEAASTEVPILRDVLSEDLFCRAYKPIVMSHFPD